MQWLVIKPESPQAETAAYALLDSKKDFDEYSPGYWPEIKEACKGRRVILLVPSEDVLLSSVNIPANNQKLIAKAVPFALEESLADDIDNIHFSFHRPTSDSKVNVAAINRDRLQSWLDSLRQHGITAHAVLPDLFMLPYKSGSASIMVQPTRAIYRDGIFTGHSAIPQLLSVLIPAQLEKHAIESLQVDSVISYSEFVPEGVTLKDGTGMNRQCHASLLDALPLNLLNQFQQKGQKNLISNLAEWRSAAILLALIGVLWGAMTGFENYRLQQQVQQLDKAITQVFTQTFPNGRVDSDYRILHATMAEKLESLAPGASKQLSSPLAPLAAVTPKITANKMIKISRLQYDETGLNLAVSAPSLGELEKFRASLDQKPIDAQIISSTTSSNSVEATMRIREEQP